MEERVGNLREIQGEVVVEWELKNFFPLSNEKEKRLTSPKFYFSGASWELWIYPNGDSDESKEWISLYLIRSSGGFAVSVDYTLSIKTVDGKTYIDRNGKEVFEKKNYGWGTGKLISNSDLLEKKSQFSASDHIIVFCILKNNEQKNTEGSLFNRLQDVSDNWKDIFAKRRRTDMILKVDGRNIPAHRIVLETGSPVFDAMFNHNTEKNKAGEAHGKYFIPRSPVCCATFIHDVKKIKPFEVNVDDCDKNSMVLILEYIYSGDADTFTTQNVLPVYGAAEKFDIKYIKAMCFDFIMRNLSVEWVCDVIKFAEKYKLEELNRRSRKFFKENANEILDTKNWATFAKENHNLAVELLGSLVKTLLPK